MKLKSTGKKILSAMLAAVMTFSVMASTAVSSVSAEPAEAGFADKLESEYVDPDRVYSSDVRWWIGEAANTDQALLEEIQMLYDSGFRGVELCMQSDNGAPDDLYAYGSEMWSHKWKLMMNKLLDLGMTVSLTSGTNWATSNVPGLDPDSQQAMHCAIMGTGTVAAGGTLSALPVPQKGREIAEFLGAYAYRETASNVVDYASGIDLTGLVSQGETVWEQNLEWTAPDDGTYRIFAYWTQGTAQAASPSQEPSYATNYFDESGVAALREFWEAHYLNDPELNQKILDGDVQLFMDSLEINTGAGFTWWNEDMAEQFEERKGYDIMPYLFLISGVSASVNNPYNSYDIVGTYKLDGEDDLRQKVINDFEDVLTQLYCERMLAPLKEWLNSVGIKTRAQISYGKPIEISEPIAYVDYPEAENLNQYNQVDVFRLWTGGAKLQNKVLSTETSAIKMAYNFSHQMHLRDAYSEFAAGFQRIIWHTWAAEYGYGNYAWPGFAPGMFGLDWFHYLGSRNPGSRDYDEFNAHLGRVQQLLQTGKSRTDVGFIHNNWIQGTANRMTTKGDALTETSWTMNWQLAHMGVFYRSTELQDNGYTYDYLSPDLLKADGVYFDEETKTVELAGYKALVLYQDWMDVDGAKLILDWAKKGLKVVIMEGAAQRTPFNDGKDAELDQVIAELKALPNVRTAEIYSESEDFNYAKPMPDGYDDGLYDALQELGVRPYTEYIEPNHQLLSQTREDEDGNRYLYTYNYCSNDYHENSYIDSVKTEDHGTNIQTEIKMEGIFVPYQIDAWTGEVTELANYYYEDGQTVFPIDLDFNNIALFAFKAVDEEPFHVTDTNAASAYMTEAGAVIRATESGDYYAVTNDGSLMQYSMDVPAAYDITDWDVTVESWTASDRIIEISETIGDLTTVNRKTDTEKTDINVRLDKLTTWDNIPEVGRDVSGLGHYEAKFNWDASKADGAYLDFGSTLEESMRVWINGVKVGGDLSQNPTKAPKSAMEGVDGDPEYTGGISWTKPIADISEYLVNGENSIVIEYSSTLSNIQMARGVTANSNAFMPSNWWGYNIGYVSYGPSQAVIVPFVEETIAAPEAEPVKSVSAPEAVQVGTNFVVKVITAASVTDVKLYNEYDMVVGPKSVAVADNEDGTKTWALILSAGTVGSRTFKVITKGPESYYKDSGKAVSLEITSVAPALNSFDLPETAVANRTFIVKATTDMAATKINVYNEFGTKMGLRSLSYKVVDGQKVWTGVMSIGTKGERTFTAYAINKYGVQSEALTDSVSVKAYA